MVIRSGKMNKGYDGRCTAICVAAFLFTTYSIFGGAMQKCVDGIHLYSAVLSGIICVKYDCIKSDLGRIKEHNPASKEDRQ